jgi:hypothetical protein
MSTATFFKIKTIDIRKSILQSFNPSHNSAYPKVAVQWLNQALYFYQSLCLVDSEVLRNRHLRVAANRYLGSFTINRKFKI